MTEMRELNEDEKRACNNTRLKIAADVDKQQWFIDEADFWLEKKIPRLTIEYQKIKQKAIKEKQVSMDTLGYIDEQLTNGVPIKDPDDASENYVGDAEVSE